MLGPFAAAILMAAQAGGTVPSAIAYIPFAGEDAQAVRALERLILAETNAGEAGAPLLRRSRMSAEAFDGCSGRRLFEQSTRCIRAALPPQQDGPPLIALSVEQVHRSNVTGSVVRMNHSIWCIGHRGVGRAELRTTIGRTTPQQVREHLGPCITAAVEGRGLPAPGRDAASGAPSWEISVRPEALAADAGMARGQAPEQAIVELLDVTSTHRNDGHCSMRGRIAYVEGGEHLRVDDLVTFSAPCRYGAQDPISRMMTQSGLTAGASARIYLDYSDGELLYLEAL